LKKRSRKNVKGNRRVGVPAIRGRKTAFPGKAVFLVGFMGAGKTSVGRVLAQRLGWTFEDLDDRIVEREGRTVAEIFQSSGEPVFRRAEQAALASLLEELHAGSSRIVALGGGAFVQSENSALLRASAVPTVFLEAPVDELWRRCCAQAEESGTERPLLRNMQQFRQLYEARRKGYLQASCQVRTGGRAVDAIAGEIAKALRLKKIPIGSEQGEVE
jgi:shikimate kinase